MSERLPSPMSFELPSMGQLWLWMAVGAGVGLLYAVTNTLMDAIAPQHPLTSLVSGLHAIIDRVIPVVAGVFCGVAVHAFRWRAVVHRLTADRARRLETRLRHVERDQAVWVVAAATLHDLRNPLHALGLLLDEADVSGAGVSRDALLTRARGKVDELHQRLARLRALAGGPRPSLDAFDVGRLARDVTTELRETLGGAIVVSAEAESVQALGDPALVRIILENLVCNAIDALTPRGRGRVLVGVASEGDEVRVSVSDDGPGLPSDIREGKFAPLTSTKDGGLGLGLPIARALARAMQSDLVAADREGYATSVELRLRAAEVVT